MAILIVVRELEGRVTLSATYSGKFVYHTWFKDGKKLENQHGAALQINCITQEDYAEYERIVTTSDGSRDSSKFLLKRPMLRSESYESIEEEVPPNIQIETEFPSPCPLVCHPPRIDAYEPPHHFDKSSIKYSSRHNLHPEVSYPKYSHSARIQPYTPQYTQPIAFYAYYYPYQGSQGNGGPLNYCLFYSPCPPSGWYNTPRNSAIQATQLPQQRYH